MNWEGIRVFVTGGAGVIGRVLIKNLVSKGAKVLSVDIASGEVFSSIAVDHIQFDLSKGVPERVFEFNPEIIFHLAATFERTEEPPGYWKTSFENDVLLSHLLLEASVQISSLKVFVFASSYLVYNPKLYLDAPKVCYLRETDPIEPRNLVGLAKYFTEREIDFVKKTEGKFRSISARIFRVFGRGSRDVISRWIRSCLKNEPIYVYGRKNRFDYIFADDVAEGLIRLVESDDAQGIINLGSGVARSIDDVVNILRDKFINLQIKDIHYDGPIESSCADMSLFHKITGWLPNTSLEKGIEQIINYEMEVMKQ